MDLLKRAETDPVPSQIVDDTQLLPVNPQILGNTSDNSLREQNVEKILRAEKKVGRGHRGSLLVKWKGFAEPTWKPRSELEDTEALDIFEAKYGTGDKVGEDTGYIIGSKKRINREVMLQAVAW